MVTPWKHFVLCDPPQHTMSCRLQGCSELQLLPWDPGVGAGDAGRCGPAGVTCLPHSVYPSGTDPGPLVPSLFTPDTGNTLWPALDKLNKKGGGNSNLSGLET